MDAITADFSPITLSLTNGTRVLVRASGANTTTTPTFAPNGLAAKDIVKNGNQPLSVGDIFGADHELDMVYNSSNDNWELLNPKVLGVGIDQTWLDLTGSRAAGVTYTNTTGKPIMVNVVIDSVLSNGNTLTVDSVTDVSRVKSL